MLKKLHYWRNMASLTLPARWYHLDPHFLQIRSRVHNFHSLNTYICVPLSLSSKHHQVIIMYYALPALHQEEVLDL